MKKKAVALLLVALVFFSSAQAAAQEAANPFERYKKKTAVISQEPLELHIGVVQTDLANNYPLEMAFLHKYPKGKIVYHYLQSEQLSAYLLSREAKLDLLVLVARNTLDYSKQGLLVDLYTTPLLSSWPDSLINIKQQMESADGGLYGFPKSVHQNVYGWNEALAQQVGVEKPNDVWSWDDYVSLCTDVNYDLDGDGSNDFCLMRGYYHDSGLSGYINDFFEQYTYQHALRGGSFQTEEFERLMRMFMAIYNSGALSGISMHGGTPVLQGQPAVLLIPYAYQELERDNWQEERILPLPTLDTSNPGYVGMLYSFSLLHNAPMREAAIEFLRSALDPDIQNMLAHDSELITKKMPEYYAQNPAFSSVGAFAPDENGEMTYTVSSTEGYIVYPVFYQEEDMEAKPISQEAFDRLIFMKEHLLPNTGHWYGISRLWFELLPQYMDGSLSFSELAAALDSRMAMMQNE